MYGGQRDDLWTVRQPHLIRIPPLPVTFKYRHTHTSALRSLPTFSLCHSAVVNSNININEKKTAITISLPTRQTGLLNCCYWLLFSPPLFVFVCCWLGVKVNMNLSARTSNMHAVRLLVIKRQGKCCWSAAQACSRACTGLELHTRKIRLSYTAPAKPR